MKNKIVFTFTFVFAFLQGCSVTPIIYHSEASLPYYHSSIKTNFEYIASPKKNRNYNSFNFAVISAKDNDTLSYVLLAPPRRGSYVHNLSDVSLSHSIPLTLTKVKEFVNILVSSSIKWNMKFDDLHGINYEFLVAPEHKVELESPNVVIWQPTFRYNFQNNRKGPLVTIIFGEGMARKVYILNKLSIIEELIATLNLAIK